MKKENITPLAELLDSVRNIEGFPIAKDKHILEISDPPYYTACPNPYIKDFIEQNSKPYNEANDNYNKAPFIGDISEGKNDPIYNAHSYHTKVPHKAIMKYIEHYTEEGDIVFDGFCGTGMTGIAAQLLNRKAILSDLSPIASFIAYNYNNPVDVKEFEKEANRIINEVEEECLWMYETRHCDDKDNENSTQQGIDGKYNKEKAIINYTVWSDVFICPFCKSEYVFWDASIDKIKGSVLKEYNCPDCSAKITKTKCERATITKYDKYIDKEITQAKQMPVMINYTYKKKRYEKKPDDFDLELIKKIEDSDIPYWFPIDGLPDGYNTKQPKISHGITHTHHFYTARNLWVLSCLLDKIKNMDNSLNSICKFIITSFCDRHIVKRNRYILSGPTRPLSGTLYVPTLQAEINVPNITKRKYKDIYKSYSNLSNILNLNNYIITTESAFNHSIIKNNSIDYIFTDPPFGENIMYSELNFIWESWLRVFTNNKTEAIINNIQKKELEEYHKLMIDSFKECYRILKPNRWITVEFHNSKSSVWNAIQDAILKAGFIVANVSILDKKHGGIKAMTYASCVEKDLVISAYKPSDNFEMEFSKNLGINYEMEWVKDYLDHQPCEETIERTEKMLYSKMLSHYIQRGYDIRYDAKDFYLLLKEYFVSEDGYWFNNAKQLNRYSECKKKVKLDNIKDIKQGSFVMFVSDEESAIIWLNSFLGKEPKKFSDIHTAYTQLLFKGDDAIPELQHILKTNFVKDGDGYRLPNTDAEKLSVIEKRDEDLIEEFNNMLFEAKTTKNKRLKSIRKAVLLYGLRDCYKQGKFEEILILSKKIDKKLIENNLDIMEFIEIAEIKVGGF